MADIKLAVLVIFLCIQVSLTARRICAISKGKPCSIAKDCKCNQCCVSNTRPVGRKKREISTGDILPGTCQPMGRINDTCFVNAGSSDKPPSDLTYRCPCKSRFTCVGTGHFDIPLGEVGYCE